ncbi:Membrane glycoprotein spo14 [Schizosaccharomyces pombe]|uniref:Membrane glycoprotein spo14 n=1 Tax=Schizosaccharomyces pombe (strain 972 / ATCC 24843) TaxID=284812 RepID=SPO14_SCHPO|nr:GDP/GTP exchange factor Spo14 [Schizosaccharomyces pombe]Q10659.1 RecName: Full=Membrane glycoprotein spo14; AltName: Full=SEC12-like protein; AltName: Full=Sporulation-specific protein 14 [Schizosaccharomyces pombe 972h-]AAA35345.1 St11p protein [Schizosaccharomyces pombe]BAA89460.1 Sec12-like protein [Schizosaccharomyces pombe]CAA20297.2 GDP/GTP exchange factor, WD repeat protein Spo14 [Schizosaccharomyces pombe]|eukprot:NP_001342743.1 GDP/GTP exchange factor Spo14 [Schizosaccharomyces pombe]
MAELHLSFPAYSLCWINNHQMAVGGGGGTTKSGVKNKLKLLSYEDYEPEVGEGHTKFIEHGEIELKHSDDAVMSLGYFKNELIAGINNTIDGKLIDHLRLYGRKDKLFEEKNALRLTDFDNDEQYQRLCLFEPLHDAICISCTNKSFFIISKNDHKVLFEKHGSDVYDVSSTEDKLAIAVDDRVEIYDWNTFELVQVLYMPVERATVRGVSFLPNQSIVAAYNYIKDSKRFASLVRFDYSSKNQLWRFGMIRDLKNAKGVTCFCCDKENGMIIVAGADCSIRFMSLDLTKLSQVYKHSLPVTDMQLSPDSEALVSVSADGLLCLQFVGKFKNLSAVKLEDAGVILRLSLMFPFVLAILYFYLQLLFPDEKLDAIHRFFSFILHIFSKYTIRNYDL